MNAKRVLLNYVLSPLLELNIILSLVRRLMLLLHPPIDVYKRQVPLLSVIFPVIDPDVVPCPKEAIDIIRQKASSIILIFKYLYM